MSELSFHPFVPVILWLPIAMVFVFVLFLEVRKPVPHRALRMVSLVVLLIALAVMILHPSYHTTAERDILLLTRASRESSVDSLLQLFPNLRLYRLPEVEGAAPILTAEAFHRERQHIRYVSGAGLPVDWLQADERFEFVHGSLHEGIVSVHVPATITRNRRTAVSGTVSHAGPARLILAGPGGAEDSVNLEAGVNRFHLNFRPRQAGRFQYSLQLKRGNHVSEEPLPLYIHETRPLRVAIVETAPSAELRTVKEFLSRQNHQVAWRYQLGRQNYGYAFLNTTSFPMGSIREEWLQQQDLLMLDAAAAKAMSTPEQKAVLQAVRKGMGVVLLGTGKEHPSWLLPATVRSEGKDTCHITTASGRSIPLPVVAVRLEGDGLQPVHTQGGRVLSGFRRMGKGVIGFTLWQETYRLQTAGFEEEYASMWNELMTTVARPSDAPEINIVNSFPILEGERLSIRVLGDIAALHLDSSRVPLDEHPVVDNLFEISVPAPSAGWHSLAAGTDSMPFAVVADTSWTTLQLHKREAQNLLAARGADNRQPAAEEREVPLWIFWLVILFAGGSLWLAGKL